MRTTRARWSSFVALLAFGLCAASTPATSPTSKDFGEAKKHLVVIGASYVTGWGQPDMPGYRVTNKGRSGDESWRVAARFQRDALASHPDAVLIWGHTNDFHRAHEDQYETTKQRAIQSYRQMIAQARAAHTTVILATDVPLPTALTWREWIPALFAWLRGKESYQERVNREVKEINEWLRTIAAQENIPLLELERAVADGHGGRRLEYSDDDRSHLSPAGYVAITQFARAQFNAWRVEQLVADR